MNTGSFIFAVQDRTGTVAQLTLDTHPPDVVEIGDTGVYTGVQPWTGTAVSFAFAVAAVNDPTNIVISTQNGDHPGNVMQSGWPPDGVILWLTGANVDASPLTAVIAMNPANAYITEEFFWTYVNSRAKAPSVSYTEDTIRGAIVVATDYIDQKYRFKGIKLLQFLGNPDLDPLLPFIDPWLSPFGFTQTDWSFIPSTTQQHTQWPRQGVVDFSGDTVYGVAQPVQQACAELVLRVLAGTVLQPDYDPNVAGGGAVVASRMEEVGPLRTSTTYDTKFGLGFFADFPQVTRILKSAGLIVAGGGTTIIR